MSQVKFDLKASALTPVMRGGSIQEAISKVSTFYSDCVEKGSPVVVGSSSDSEDNAANINANIVMSTQDVSVVLTAAFMEAAGQTILSYPGMPDAKTRALRGRLHLEETLELIVKGLGLKIKVDVDKLDEHGCLTEESLQLVDNPTAFSLKEVEDGLIDIKVISIGTYLSHGMAPSPLVEQEVLVNNLSKFRTDKDGYRNKAGKWVKPSDHPEPRIEAARSATQGVLDEYAHFQALQSSLPTVEDIDEQVQASGLILPDNS